MRLPPASLPRCSTGDTSPPVAPIAARIDAGGAKAATSQAVEGLERVIARHAHPKGHPQRKHDDHVEHVERVVPVARHAILDQLALARRSRSQGAYTTHSGQKIVMGSSGRSTPQAMTTTTPAGRLTNGTWNARYGRYRRPRSCTAARVSASATRGRRARTGSGTCCTRRAASGARRPPASAARARSRASAFSMVITPVKKSSTKARTHGAEQEIDGCTGPRARGRAAARRRAARCPPASGTASCSAGGRTFAFCCSDLVTAQSGIERTIRFETSWSSSATRSKSSRRRGCAWAFFIRRAAIIAHGRSGLGSVRMNGVKSRASRPTSSKRHSAGSCSLRFSTEIASGASSMYV